MDRRKYGLDTHCVKRAVNYYWSSLKQVHWLCDAQSRDQSVVDEWMWIALRYAILAKTGICLFTSHSIFATVSLSRRLVLLHTSKEWGMRWNRSHATTLNSWLIHSNMAPPDRCPFGTELSYHLFSYYTVCSDMSCLIPGSRRNSIEIQCREGFTCRS